MTLGQCAVAVGAPPRWVLNALTRLRVPRRYDEALAKRLSFARLLAAELHMELRAAWKLARTAIAATNPFDTWRLQSEAGVALVVDMPRFYSTFLARLALARVHEGKKPGRKPKRRQSAVARARKRGIDIPLLEARLRLTPAQRLSALYDDASRLGQTRVALR